MSTATSHDAQSVEADDAGTQEPKSSTTRRRGLIIALGATAAAAGTAWLLLASPVFGVDQVKVSGNAGIPSDEVVSVSGIVTGAPLLTVDTTAAAEKVSQMESVASASVSRQWPNAVAITVVPDAAVAFSPNGDQWDVWGAAGGRLGIVTEPPADLPELRNVPEQARAEALAVTASLPPEVRTRVGAVSLQEGRGYLLELKEGAGTVRWGDAGESGLKATVLTAMMSAAPDARWFDVSSPTAPRSAVSEPARLPRNGATPSPSPTFTVGTPETGTPGQPEETGGQESGDETDAAVPSGGGGGGESPLGLQPQ